FSTRADVDPIWQDVQDGIIRHVSVGYITHELEEQERRKGELPVYVARRWEPTELSLVAVAADDGAQVRAATDGTRYPCQLTGCSARAAPPATADRPKATPARTRAAEERPPGDPGVPPDDNGDDDDGDDATPTPPPAPDKADSSAARAAERQRVKDIRH